MTPQYIYCDTCIGKHQLAYYATQSASLVRKVKPEWQFLQYIVSRHLCNTVSPGSTGSPAPLMQVTFVFS